MPTIVPNPDPPQLPAGMRIDTPLRERWLAEGPRWARQVQVLLQHEDAICQHWNRNVVAWVERGWQRKEQDSKTILQQILIRQPDGKYTLTAIGEQRLELVRKARPQTQQRVVAPPVFGELPAGLERILWPYQRLPARQIYRALTNGRDEWGYPGAVDLSDMGTGKTAMDIAAAIATGRKIIVLCPTVGEAGWRKMFAIFNHEPHYIGTYEALRGGWRPHIVDMHGPNGPRWHHPSEIIIILDEAQALRHDDTLNVKCCAAAIAQGIPLITASATIATSPLEFRFAGRITGLHGGGPEWDRFLARHGCSRRKIGEPWRWDGNLIHLDAINTALFPRRGARVRKEELGDECPETRIEVLAIEGDDAARVNEMWRKTEAFINAERRRGQKEHVVRAMEQKAHQKNWQTSEILLVPHIAKRIRKDLDDGRSVAVFCNFNESRLQLARMFNTNAGFYGGQRPQVRQYWEKEFQANRQHLLVSNIRAGGASVSLHDTTGDRPRTAYIFPTDRVVDMKQATGRVDRVGGKSLSLQFIPCFVGSLTEDMVHRTRTKMLNMAALNDGSARALSQTSF